MFWAPGFPSVFEGFSSNLFDKTRLLSPASCSEACDLVAFTDILLITTFWQACELDPLRILSLKKPAEVKIIVSFAYFQCPG